MEGCIGKGPCPRCGEVNYGLMGWYGAVARWAKAWGVTEHEAETRIAAHQIARDEAVLEASECATYGPVEECAEVLVVEADWCRRCQDLADLRAAYKETVAE
jgi:hypothetical protein